MMAAMRYDIRARCASVSGHAAAGEGSADEKRGATPGRKAPASSRKPPRAAACGCSGASVIDRTGVTHAAVPPKTRSQCARVSVANRSANSALSTGQLALSARSGRSEEHTSELQSLMRISYAVFCLKKKKTIIHRHKRQ